ncbi:MAG: hypothetical protein L0H31_06365, partial [Nocardioidaceae bacterium]|nr:hypothetical protein [Nocardioidaceae bacterium]
MSDQSPGNNDSRPAYDVYAAPAYGDVAPEAAPTQLTPPMAAPTQMNPYAATPPPPPGTRW